MLDPRWILNLLFFFINYSNAPFNNTPHKKTVKLSKILILGALSTLIIPAYACGSFAIGLNYSNGLALGGYLWVLALLIAGLCTFIRKHNQNGAIANDSEQP